MPGGEAFGEVLPPRFELPAGRSFATPSGAVCHVQTQRGAMMIAGDNVDLLENWEGNEQYHHVPGGTFTNLEDYFDSLRRMETMADAVLPAHDYCVLDSAWQPWKS